MQGAANIFLNESLDHGELESNESKWTVEEEDGFLKISNYQYYDKLLAERINYSYLPFHYFSQWYKFKQTGEYSSHIPHDWSLEKSIFIYGRPGVGKTLTAIDIAVDFLRKGKGVRYFTCKKLTDYIEENNSLKFDRHEKARVNQMYKKLQSIISNIDLLIIDEIVSINSGVIEGLEHLLELRYQTGKPTIYISNHSFDKNESLNKRSIEEITSERIASRLKETLQISCKGMDLRGSITSECDTEGFRMPNLILANLALPHIPTFAARNMIFKSISTKERAALTERMPDGRIEELPRKSGEYLTSVWEENDSISIQGAVCCDNDAKILIAALQVLAKRHADGANGLSIRLTASEICEIIGAKKSGVNNENIRRALNRLSSMVINYKSPKGFWFIGTFLTVGGANWKTSDSYIDIDFNKRIVPFYLGGAYSVLRKHNYDLSSIEYLLSLFLCTHSDDKAFLHNDTLLRMLGKEGLTKQQKQKFLERTRARLKKAQKDPKAPVASYDGKVISLSMN